MNLWERCDRPAYLPAYLSYLSPILHYFTYSLIHSSSPSTNPSHFLQIFQKDAVQGPVKLALKQAFYDEANWESILEHLCGPQKMIESAGYPAANAVGHVASMVSLEPAEMFISRNFQHPRPERSMLYERKILGLPLRFSHRLSEISRLFRRILFLPPVNPPSSRQLGGGGGKGGRRSSGSSSASSSSLPSSSLSVGSEGATATGFRGGFFWTLQQSIRATTAAPSFFTPLNIDGKVFCDGAIFANNPTAAAYREARRLYPDVPIEAVVSVGCGCFPEKNVKHEGWSSIAGQLVQGATDTERIHHVLSEFLPEESYFRINPKMRLIKIDETDPEVCGLTNLCAWRSFDNLII